MAKKDFSTLNTDPVYNTLAQATAETQEVQETPKRGRPRRMYDEYNDTGEETSSRRDKLPRINMAFSVDNYEYIQTMARVSGMSLTDFVNNVVYSHRQQHKDLYEQAIEFKKNI